MLEYLILNTKCLTYLDHIPMSHCAPIQQYMSNIYKSKFFVLLYQNPIKFFFLIQLIMTWRPPINHNQYLTFACTELKFISYLAKNTMVHQCLFGCSPPQTLFSFPRQFCGYWPTGEESGICDRSRLCAKHFTVDCFNSYVEGLPLSHSLPWWIRCLIDVHWLDSSN